MMHFNISPSEEGGFLFSNLIFTNPMIFFQGTDPGKAMADAIDNGLVPIVVISDANNELMIDIEQGKPPEFKDKKIQSIILAVKYKQNYWA